MIHLPPRSSAALHLAHVGLAMLIAAAAPSAISAPPASEKRPVTDEYHGTKVTEDYRWLEVSDDPAVKTWNAAQNAYARSVLDQLPGREAIAKRVTEIMSAETVSYGGVVARGGKFFAMKHQPPKQQPFIVLTESLEDLSGERVLVDPSELDTSGGTAITWFEPSPDGTLIAVSLAKGGDEVGDLTVFDVATGKPVGEVVPRVNTGTAGGDLKWAPDGSGFFYTRHPREGERTAEDMNFYQQVYFHKLGTPTADDRYEMGQDSPRIAETELKVDDRTGRVLATVQNGDGGEFAHFLREPDGTWRQFSRFADKIIQAEFGPNDDLYVVSRQGAPRGKIVRVPIAAINEADGWEPYPDSSPNGVARPESSTGVVAPEQNDPDQEASKPRPSVDLRACHPAIESAEVVVPEGKDAIVTSFWHDSTIVPTDSRLYVVYQLGGPSEIRVFDLAGKPQPAPKQLPVSSVGSLVRLEGDDILFDNESFVKPSAIYRYHAKSGEVTQTALRTDEPVNLDDAEVVREFATSKDGTQVPVNIIMRQGTKRDGQNPALATAYGGYGVNTPPGFSALRRILLDHGFVVAVVNVRGGGEYGEEWHRQGNLTKKQNVFDDFAAALKHLAEQKYTSPERLAIVGGSNGGLLMGATFTQHPELMKAVVSLVGIYDMLRVELSPNGAFNVTEFGTVQNPDHFKALYAYSPYHNVQEGARFPAVLFLTGENDPRVEPMQSRKMTARLQAASPSGGPFLLRTSAEAGHGRDTPLAERIAQQVDIYAFLFDQLGVSFATTPAAAGN